MYHSHYIHDLTPFVHYFARNTDSVDVFLTLSHNTHSLLSIIFTSAFEEFLLKHIYSNVD